MPGDGTGVTGSLMWGKFGEKDYNGQNVLHVIGVLLISI